MYYGTIIELAIREAGYDPIAIGDLDIEELFKMLIKVTSELVTQGTPVSFEEEEV